MVAAVKKIPVVAWVFALTHAAMVLYLLASTPICESDCRESGTRLAAERKIHLVGQPPPFNYLMTFDLPWLILSILALFPFVGYPNVVTYLDALMWIGPVSIPWGLIGWGIQLLFKQLNEVRRTGL